jgi:hypothetical protein
MQAVFIIFLCNKSASFLLANKQWIYGFDQSAQARALMTRGEPVLLHCVSASLNHHSTAA